MTSKAPTGFLDSAHRACFDADSMVVTLTAHGSGHDVIPVTRAQTHADLRKIVKETDWNCCEWITRLYLLKGN
jgi:hypothetical protein